MNHCVWQAQNLAYVLESDAACEKFLALLGRYKEEFGIEIRSYCLMGTHPHVVCRAVNGQADFSEFWKRVNWGFAFWFNRRTKGCGKVVMERMQSPEIQDERHALNVMRYGDMNPVRAGVVPGPSNWKWSSHAYYAYGAPNPLITDSPEYLALGRDGPSRREAYRHLFADAHIEAYRSRRPEFVRGRFIGDADWIAARLVACDLSPPPD